MEKVIPLRMKTGVCLMVGLCLLAIGCTTHKTQKQKNDLTQEELKGKVKVLRRYSNRSDNSLSFTSYTEMVDTPANYQLISCKFFDEKGNISKEMTFFRGNGEPPDSSENKRDGTGKIIETTGYYTLEHRNFNMKYTYDAKGNNTEIIYYKEPGDSLMDKYVLRYDKNNNMIESSFYDGKLKLDEKVLNTYDEKGNRIKGVLYGAKQDSIEDGFLWTYDEAGNMIKEEKFYNTPADINTTTEYTYDENGNKTEEVKTTRSYCEKTTFSYDNKGNQVMDTIKQEPEGTVIGYTIRVYDNEGNWVKETMYHCSRFNNKDRLVGAYKREIEYYK